MSYRIKLDQSPGASLRRSATERIERAIGQLDSRRNGNAVEAIHEARKDVKKTRSLLRLYRSELGTRDFRRHNSALRAAAAELSGLRDADVMLETVDMLAERYNGQLPRARLHDPARAG